MDDVFAPKAPHIPSMLTPKGNSPAELFIAGRRGSQTPSMNYRRFDRWQDAVRHAVEVVDLAKFPGTVIEVAELRYDSHQIFDAYATLGLPDARMEEQLGF